jgi:arabinan endo-1,5-alpha-L-arabinosidase
MVCRSTNIKGPYIDRNGVSLNQSGGSLIQQGNEHYSGTGHNAVYAFNGTDYIVYHAYNTVLNGKPELIIQKLSWDKDGWPVINDKLQQIKQLNEINIK